VYPRGIVSVPGELAAALRTLPEVLDTLRRVGDDTRQMDELMDGLQASLGQLHGSLEALGRLAGRIPRGNRCAET